MFGKCIFLGNWYVLYLNNRNIKILLLATFSDVANIQSDYLNRLCHIFSKNYSATRWYLLYLVMPEKFPRATKLQGSHFTQNQVPNLFDVSKHSCFLKTSHFFSFCSSLMYFRRVYHLDRLKCDFFQLAFIIANYQHVGRRIRVCKN